MQPRKKATERAGTLGTFRLTNEEKRLLSVVSECTGKTRVDLLRGWLATEAGEIRNGQHGLNERIVFMLNEAKALQRVLDKIGDLDELNQKLPTVQDVEAVSEALGQLGDLDELSEKIPRVQDLEAISEALDQFGDLDELSEKIPRSQDLEAISEALGQLGDLDELSEKLAAIVALQEQALENEARLASSRNRADR